MLEQSNGNLRFFPNRRLLESPAPGSIWLGLLAEDVSSKTPLAAREIRLTLDEDMERYVWFLNNKPLSETDHIEIKRGEVVRFIMINRSMMHHPMHLHGHFFRVLNAQGKYSPLKHTVDVPPMTTTVIEFAADEFGDWFFHCHPQNRLDAALQCHYSTVGK